jgi:hypothetical protein
LASAEGRASVPDPEGLFSRLPSVKLFTDQVEQARAELVVRWDGYGGEDEFPLLWQIFLTARAQAKGTLRLSAEEPTASEFLDRWGKLDRRFGDPLQRGWILTTVEAAARFEAITDYLHAAGELNVLRAKPDSPEEYISKAEADGT